MRSRPEDYGHIPAYLPMRILIRASERNEAESAYTRSEALRTVSFMPDTLLVSSLSISWCLLHTIPIHRQLATRAAFAMVIASIGDVIEPFWGYSLIVWRWPLPHYQQALLAPR